MNYNHLGECKIVCIKYDIITYHYEVNTDYIFLIRIKKIIKGSKY